MSNEKRIMQIFRDGRKVARSLTAPLMNGEQGNAQTLAVMADIVREDSRQPDLRIFVLRNIIGDVAGHDFNGEVQRIFDFCQGEITYRKDPWNVERVADIWSTMYALNPNGPEGDCGIKSVFLATCCALLGHRPRFRVIKQNAKQPNFNHVYCMVNVNGFDRSYDPTPEDKPAGWEVNAPVVFDYPIFP